MEIRCPAKINTFLSVGGPEPNGYHPIWTVFQAISLADTLIVEPSSSDLFQCDSPDVPEDNTVTKAWRLAREYVGLPTLRIELKKQVPPLSGLGGGSSDAAGLLRSLIVLTRGKFGPKEAHEVATAVGSDVPFFLVGGRAKGEGYGEVLTPLPDAEPRWLLIGMPSATVSTKDAYEALDRTDRYQRQFPDDPWAVHNDFEAVAPVASQYAIALMDRIGAEQAGLTGSGAAVFGLFKNRAHATQSERAWKLETESPVWLCHTLSREESLWTS